MEMPDELFDAVTEMVALRGDVADTNAEYDFAHEVAALAYNFRVSQSESGTDTH